MGGVAAGPINEIIALQEKLNRSAVERLRQEHPSIADQINASRWMGEEPESLEITREKAAVVVEVLESTEKRCAEAIASGIRRIKGQRQLRLAADLLALLGASSVVGSLGLGRPTVAIIAAVITLAASGFKMVSEFVGSAPGGSANLTAQAVYERLSVAILDIRTWRTEIRILSRHSSSASEINEAIGKANALCRGIMADLSSLLIKTSELA